MTAAVLCRFAARDGVELVWHELGEGHPLVLLHGLFSSATVNWIRYGHAQMLSEAGFKVVMPDLRAHGDSDKPHAGDRYPPNVLVDDLCDLIDHLKLNDFDLGGFSLGARTCAQAVIQGLDPRRLVLGGMGLSGLSGWHARRAFFERAITQYATAKREDDVWMAIQFMKTMKVDRVAAGHLLKSIRDTEPDQLRRITMPTLVVCGEQDEDNGSPSELVAALPQATLAKVPGNHMSSVTQPALGRAIAEFLTS